MSDFADKLQPAPRTIGTAAEATLKQLKVRRGYRFIDEDTVAVDAMDGEELWSRTSGRGLEAMFRKSN